MKINKKENTKTKKETLAINFEADGTSVGNARSSINYIPKENGK